MTILAYAPNYLPDYRSGDTTCLHDILKFLQSKGHHCEVMLNKGFIPYVHDGISVMPRQGTAFARYDLILTQLDCTRETIQLASHKPIIAVLHNTFPYPSITEAPEVGVIYNSEAAINETNYPDNPFYVLPPVVDPVYYDVPQETVSTRNMVTLINCNENKGGKIFHEIARTMPEYQFLAVLGAYGEQHVSLDPIPKPFHNLDNKAIINGLGALPNVTVWENQGDIREVYRQTRILLMPSLYESWGRVATEAMCSGIPVICTKTFGIKENVGISGNFIEDRNDINSWVMAIKKLDGKKEYQSASELAKKRSMELHPKEKLEGLEKFATKFVADHKKKREYGKS